MSDNGITICPELTHLFSIRRDMESSGNGRMHGHPFWELILFVRGEGTHTINGTTYRFQPGDLSLLAPSDFHQLRAEENTTFDSIKVGFTYNIYGGQLKNICSFDRFPINVSLNDADYAKVVTLLEMLADEYVAPQLPGREAFSANLLEQLMILVARNMSEQKKIQIMDASNTRKILLYIQQHFTEPIDIKDVAKSLNYSSKYFGQLFLKQMGITFQEYLKSLRMNYAYHLIQYSNRSIIDICYETCFRSPTYFSKCFKQKYGLSPNHLRKNDGQN